MPTTRALIRILLISMLLAAGVGLSTTAGAQTLPLVDLGGDSSPQSDAPPDPQALRRSLDHVIETLENDQRRAALLDELKSLRDSTHAESQAGAANGEPRHGLLGALADSFSDLSDQAETGNTPIDVWAARSSVAATDLGALWQETDRPTALRNLSETAIGLGIWLALLLTLMAGGRAFCRRRGWPLTLPPEPRPWMLVVHFLRRIVPWLATFALLLFSLQWLQASAPARAAVLVVAYVALCGRALATVFDVVVSLFTRGHRRVAVAILHDTALKPLFFIGALLAFSDAVNTERLTALLGQAITSWLSALASAGAGLVSIGLVLRIRRPVQHLIRNRRWHRRQRGGTLRDLLSLVARVWHVAALLLIGVSLTALFLTGGETGAALTQSMLCTVLLVITVVVTGVLRRQQEKSTRRPRKSQYANRLARFGYTLAHCLAWAVCAELSLRVWGFSLIGIGEDGAVSARIGHALLGIGLTVLIAWLAWIFADTAIQRALSGGQGPRGRRRNTMRAQTITPMIRNIALFTILIIAAIVGLANLGVNVTPLLAGAGVIGLAVGFGAQTLVQDLITGVFILIEDSLAVGDFVEINGYMGSVEGLNLRAVRLRDLDGVLHITTFSHIDSIHNMSRQFGVALMKLRIPADMPIDDAVALMHKTAGHLREDPLMRRLIWSSLEMQGIQNFEDGCPILRMRLRTAPEYQWDVARAFNLRLKQNMEAQYVDLAAPRLSLAIEGRGGQRFDARGRLDNAQTDEHGQNLDDAFSRPAGPSPEPG